MPREPSDEHQQNLVRQIQAAWSEAQAQLKLLREQVEHASALAQAKVASNVLQRDLERAYRNLGEAVWADISKGKLTLPTNLSAVTKALEEVTTNIRAQNASINELLDEGVDIAARLQKRLGATKAVAPGSKKK